MKKVILASVISFIAGAASTFLLTQKEEQIHVSTEKKEVEKPFTLEGSRWIDESNYYELAFSDNDNSCFIIKIADNISIPFTYSKIQNELKLEPKNEMTSLFLLAQFSDMNLTGKLESNNKLTIEGRSKKITFKAK